MTETPKATLIMHDFPPDLRAELVERAEREGSNMTAVAVGILARSFGFRFAPAERKTTGVSPAKTTVKLTYPRRLDHLIEDEKNRRRRRGENGLSKKAVVIDRLRAGIATA